MLYREVGQYKTNYAADMAVFPILQDRIGIAVILLVAFVVIPTSATTSCSTPSSSRFSSSRSPRSGSICSPAMPVCFRSAPVRSWSRRLRLPELTTIFPHVNIVIWIFASGLFSAAVGALFGLPSLRIKGFYLAVATLAAQFFLEWCFIRAPGCSTTASRCDPGAAAEARRRADYRTHRHVADALSGRAEHRRRDDLVRVEPRAWPYGRMWMSVRDMDLAAELVGIRLLRTKLLAFAVSSFYCGVAGAMMVFLWYGGAGADVFAIDQSFLVLFMVIIGGLGTYRLVLRCRSSTSADCAAGHSPGVRAADPPGGRRAAHLRDRRRVDHRLPDP